MDTAVADVIDVDIRPWIVAEVQGRVVLGDNGTPSIVADSPARWLTALGRCIDKSVRVRLFRQKERRTPEANNYIWGIVYPDILAGLKQLAEDVGELPVFTDEDDLHEAMKWTFLRRVYALPGAGELEAMPRSSKLSKAEFSEYVDKVKRWAAERRIWVREPLEGMAA